ncbi:MAG TPA: efflux RND transporter periplasmic adaptor subunit [Bacteroidales bacterium]|jgi:RND family efflux transporter MFP subunit|nr:efflux RND transporter periplasmic adaptor subunit [Bacteroidales bacterium]
MIRPFFYLILLPAVFCGCRHTETKNAAEQILHVKVSPVTTRAVSMPVHAAGILSSSEEMKLSFKTGGIISRIDVSEGDRVKKGQALAILDLSEVSSAVTQARNAFEKARRDFNRAENLYRDSVATLEMKQNAATALDVAKSVYETAQFNLAHSTITAPDNGIILKQLARQNELISSGYPVFLFGSSGKYWKVKAGLSDRDMVKVHPGDSAVVTFDAWPGEKFPAVTDQVSGMADPYTGTYEAGILIQDRGLKLASGFIAGVDIFPSLKKEYTVVPVGAIVEADGHEGYIFAVSDSMTVRKIRIKIEGMPEEYAAVSGINGISSVVSEGAAYLRDGMKVEVIR